MGKILVGRDEQREVEVGFNLATGAKDVKNEADAEQVLVEEPTEEVVLPAEEAEPEAPEAQAADVKRRGKKRGKA